MIEYFLALVVFYVFAHFFNIIQEVIESLLEGSFVTLTFGLKQLKKLLIVGLGSFFSSLHRFEIILFDGFIEFLDFGFDFVLANLPSLVNIHFPDKFYIANKTIFITSIRK